MTARFSNGTLLAARLALAGCLVPTAISRALNPSGFAMALATEGLPFTTELATAIVVIGAAAPLALAIGVLPRTVAALVIVQTAFVTLVLHRFWEFGGVFRQAEQATALANLALIGAMLLYMQAGPGDWGWAGLRRRLFGEGGAPERKRAAPKGGRALKAA
jgi:uncharacterized membrane protein YphA (DoxX/SURF4 family)